MKTEFKLAPSKRYAVKIAAISVNLCLLALFSVQAQPYQLGTATVKGARTTSHGGDYEIRGSIGSIPTRPAMDNGEYAVSGSLVALFVAVTTTGAPTLNITVTTTNTVVLSWLADSTGFVVEQNVTANGTGWSRVGIAAQNSGGNYHVVLPMSAGNKFFRLQRP